MEKDEGVVTMCLISGVFVIGTLTNGDILHYPRIWHLIKNGTEQQMLPLPGCPLSATLPPGTLNYPVPKEDVKMHELYKRVTAVHVQRPKLTIVEPASGKAN